MHLHINPVILKDVLQLYTVVIGCVCIFLQDFMTDTNMSNITYFRDRLSCTSVNISIEPFTATAYFHLFS